jgi:hypothetical protein
LKQKIDKVGNQTGDTREERMEKTARLLIQVLQCYEPNNRNVIVMQYIPSFHQIVIEKLKNFSDPNTADLRDASRYFQQTIRELARHLLPHVQTIVSAPVPIQGSLHPIVIQGCL